MTRFTLIGCFLLSLSLGLMPLSSLHMHLHADHQVEVHGGHMHLHADADDEDEVELSSQIIDIYHATVDVGKRNLSFFSLDVLPVALLAALFAVPFLSSVLRPPTVASPHFSSTRHYWQPPLRGPPAIAA